MEIRSGSLGRPPTTGKQPLVVALMFHVFINVDTIGLEAVYVAWIKVGQYLIQDVRRIDLLGEEFSLEG